jgi:hypothetical protein
MKYDMQVTITAAGYSRTLQACLDYEVKLPDPGNGSRLDIEISGVHVFSAGSWSPWPHFMDLMSDGQRTTIMTEMFEAWCSSNGMPIVERVEK